MEIKFNITLNQAFFAFLLSIIALTIGIVIAPYFNIPLQENQDQVTCLQTTDLNREDIGMAILLTRFCEGQGLQSSIYWQQDLNGNVYGMPICLPSEDFG